MFNQIFKGRLASEKGMFLNPGFRGVKIFPYPEHIKQMVEAVTVKVRKISPDIKIPIYRAIETQVNIDI